MKARMTLVLLSTLLLLSCTVGPNYKPVIPNFSDRWSSHLNTHKVNVNDPINIVWWEQFHDPLLTQFIIEAVHCNRDIKIAEANIRNARALRAIAASSFYPKIDSYVSDQSKRISIRGSQLSYFKILKPQDVFLQRRLYDIGFDASWEIDVFGLTRREVEAQNDFIGQQIAERRKVLLTTIAEVARNYMEYRGNEELIRYTKKSIRSQKKNLDVITERFRAGEDNNLNVSLAKSEWRTTQAKLPTLIAQKLSHAYQLAVLLGRDPQDILHDLAKPYHRSLLIRSVPIGLRSDILCRRPDVAVAERAFAQSIAEIGVAVAEQYPRFTLIGNYGYDSVKLNQFFASTSQTWVFGPSVTWPIFRGGALLANIESKKALANAALYQYQSVVLHALQDADTALVRYSQELDTYQRLKAAVLSHQRTVRITKERYHDGEDDVLALVIAEQSLYNSQINFIDARTNSLTNLISLYKALGSGWEVFGRHRA